MSSNSLLSKELEKLEILYDPEFESEFPVSGEAFYCEASGQYPGACSGTKYAVYETT
jgi:hypothetical protein